LKKSILRRGPEKNNKSKTQKGGRTLAYEVTPWRRTGALRPFWGEMDDLWNRFF
jgi:hypothetical protein